MARSLDGSFDLVKGGDTSLLSLAVSVSRLGSDLLSIPELENGVMTHFVCPRERSEKDRFPRQTVGLPGAFFGRRVSLASLTPSVPSPSVVLLWCFRSRICGGSESQNLGVELVESN